MMKWSDRAPEIPLQAVATYVDGRGLVEVVSLLCLAAESPVVVMPPRCRASIASHLADHRTEAGGLLLGHVYCTGQPDGCRNPMIVTIQDHVASKEFDATGVSLRMDTDIWDRTSEMLAGLTVLVGWYHSHPGLGVFFSGTDRNTQRAFFRQPYSLGLVIDPRSDKEKWFVGCDSAEIPSRNILTTIGS